LVVKRQNLTLNELFVEHILDISIETSQFDMVRTTYLEQLYLIKKQIFPLDMPSRA